MTMAERVGFEPTRPLRAYGISSAAPSTELGDRSAARLATTADATRFGAKTATGNESNDLFGAKSE